MAALMLLTMMVLPGKAVGQTPVFNETFAGCNSTGGNDGSWSGSIASGTLTDGTSTDNSGWTFSNGKAAKACAKFGTGSNGGSAQTPSITFTGNATLSFKAGAWNGNNEATTLSLSATNGSLDKNSVTLTKGAWGNYTVNITGVTSTTKITFYTSNGNNRFFLDDVKVITTPTVEAPTFDPVDGTTFEDELTITINSASGTTIYYTTDGSEPSVSGDGYGSSTNVTITGTTTIKAIADDGSYSSSKAEATYTRVYHITVLQPDGGVISSSSTQASVGTEVSLTATANVGYSFNSWSISPDVSLSDNKFDMPANDVTITAIFNEIPAYTVSFSINGNIEMTAKVNSGTELDTRNFVANVVTDGYAFDGWYTAASGGDKIDDIYTPTSNIAVHAQFVEASDEYTLVTNVSDLEAGNLVVITARDSYAAMSTEQKSNNRGEYAITKDSENSTITWDPDDPGGDYIVCEFVLGGSSSGWTFFDEGWGDNGGFLYSAGTKTTKTNYLRTRSSASVDDDEWGIWEITIDSENNYKAIVRSKGNSNTPFMRYNSGMFACYNTQSQSDIVIYTKPSSSKGLRTDAIEAVPNVKAIADNVMVTVKNGGVVTLTGNNNGNYTNLVIEDGGQLICNNSVAATVYKTIEAWNTDNKTGWYLLASPIQNATITGISNLITTGSGYDLFRYNESDNMWQIYKTPTPAFTSFEDGRGYLYRNAATQYVTFTGNTNTSVTYNLSYANAAGDLKGFNIIGNPFTHNITWTDITKSSVNPNGYYTLGTDGNWTIHKLGDLNTNTIAPMQGFLVQATGADPSVTFGAAGKNNENKANNDYIKLSVSNSQYNDVTYALFDKGDGINKIDHRNAEIPMLYIPQDGKNYAIATMGDDTQMFNLSFKAMTMGKYTISMNAKGNFRYIHLIDRLTGDDTNLLIEDYSFIGSPQDNAERFIVKLSYDNDSSTSSETFAYQSGNEIIVNGEGTLEVYDVTGRKVMTTTINGVETINGLNSGVYIFRVIGETLRTQKIVVR